MHSTGDLPSALVSGLERRLLAFVVSVVVFAVLLAGTGGHQTASVLDSVSLSDLVVDGAERFRSTVADGTRMLLLFTPDGTSTEDLYGDVVAAVEADGWDLSVAEAGLATGTMTLDGQSIDVSVELGSGSAVEAVTVELSLSD